MIRKAAKYLLTVVLIVLAWGASTQYNKEYFFHMGRKSMMNNNYQDAIQTLNVLLRFDQDAYEAYFLRGIAKYNMDDLLGADTLLPACTFRTGRRDRERAPLRTRNVPRASRRDTASRLFSP